MSDTTDEANEGRLSEAAGQLMDGIKQLTKGRWAEYKQQSDESVSLFLTGEIGGPYSMAAAQDYKGLTTAHSQFGNDQTTAISSLVQIFLELQVPAPTNLLLRRCVLETPGLLLLTHY